GHAPSECLARQAAFADGNSYGSQRQGVHLPARIAECRHYDAGSDACLAPTETGVVDGSSRSGKERGSVSYGEVARGRISRARYGENAVWRSQRGPGRFGDVLFNRSQLFYKRGSHCCGGGRFPSPAPRLSQEPWRRLDWVGAEARGDVSMERRVHPSAQRGAHARYET